MCIGGFIIGGTGNKSVLLRALGPTLAQFGITDPLQDPTIELHAGNGSLLSSNDNWKDTQQAAISATGKAQPDDKESAVLSNNLAAGNYTAIVRELTTWMNRCRLLLPTSAPAVLSILIRTS
ncbi:MAG: hypothetical protein DME45_12385 [Verrucomicrobia bacterium]|nr:MAG: hypothetical protein DME45_12385 [Verrucomicrobiota bacterium]